MIKTRKKQENMSFHKFWFSLSPTRTHWSWSARTVSPAADISWTWGAAPPAARQGADISNVNTLLPWKTTCRAQRGVRMGPLIPPRRHKKLGQATVIAFIFTISAASPRSMCLNRCLFGFEGPEPRLNSKLVTRWLYIRAVKHYNTILLWKTRLFNHFKLVPMAYITLSAIPAMMDAVKSN